MTEYILSLIAEADDHKSSLELRVDGAIPRVGETFTLEKEYPACKVTYRVRDVSPVNIKVPKDPAEVYKADPVIVTALREPNGFEKI